MSLILEALRKSEAERRLGSAPGVLAVMPVLRAPMPSSRWPLALAGIGIATLIAVLALTWWWTHQSRVGVARSPATPSARTATNSNANARFMTHTANNAAAVADAARTPQSLPGIRLPATNVARPASPKTVAPALPQAPTAASMPKRTTTIAIGSTHPVIDPATPLASNIAKPDVKPVAPAPSAAQAAPVEPLLLSVNDLPADERGDVPALKVSMHVYADDPAQRFMIVNGQRVGEGARIADGVVVVHIRRDGAEIDLHGRRLLLPKP